MNTFRHFRAIYRLYRTGHPRSYALLQAYRIAIKRSLTKERT